MFRKAFLPIFAILLGFSVTHLVLAESLREFHQRQCESGKPKSCERAAAMLEGEVHADRIVELGDKFAMEVDRSIMEEDNKPILKIAYIDVIADYFREESGDGIKQVIFGENLSLCAEHYHHYWRNQKMIWPINDEGMPDWSTIYYYIVEHYYGYCLRSVL